jgi:hypothetical protein
MNHCTVKYSLDYGTFGSGPCVRAVTAESEAEAYRTVSGIGNDRIKRHNAETGFTPYVWGTDIYDIIHV